MEKNFYIKQLKKKDIAKFLKTINLELAEDLIDRKTQKKVQPAKKFYDKKNDEVTILIRASKIKNSESKLEDEIILKLLLKTGLGSIPFITSAYYQIKDKVLLLLTDFMANEILLEEKNPLIQSAFVDFMASKFGNEYINDYNKFVKEYNAKLEQNNDEGSGKED